MPEIETPVSPPEIAGASLTSHLSVHFPADRMQEAAFSMEADQREIAAGADGMKLPATLAESLALQTEINRSVPADKRFVAIKATRMAKLAAHIHSQSQGPIPPPIDHKEFWKRTPPASALARVAEMYSKPKARKG